jgi:hypothetical protein
MSEVPWKRWKQSARLPQGGDYHIANDSQAIALTVSLAVSKACRFNHCFLAPCEAKLWRWVSSRFSF